MLKFVFSRLLTMIPLLFAISSFIFLMLHLVPGSVAEILLEDAATPEYIEIMEEQLGLNDPLPVQYVRWLRGVIVGDFGNSLLTGRSVWDIVWGKFFVTLSLTTLGMFIGISLGLIAGITAGLNPGSLIDRLATLIASIGVAIPPFWLALILVVWFAVELRWLPSFGYTPLTDDPVQWLRRLILPALSLGLPASALIARQMRTSMTHVMQQEYIRAARAAGVFGFRLVSYHALPNAMIPVTTVIGFRFARIFGAAFVVEQVFALPGLGKLLVDAVLDQDIPVVQGIALIAAISVVITNLLVDLSYGWLNPKVRLS